ncbi:MAG: hypothetical protein CVV23_09655 [Ignavibacteriae bacterium HGW-Ignavibacteriae-2]|jgi:signal-transduction protein with cAMP-binding, CBS, and nucleotidyltransferase domain|nr:MAG: hypothetical protein CVV23_09655 [Ignavibacteriae bacterium HGW-Ignavibacteriae-2]
MFTAEDILNQKDVRMISCTPDTLIKDALKVMVEKKIGSIIVKDGDNVSGIWTERDLMRNVIDKSINLDTALISEHMTKSIRSAPFDSSIFQLLDIFLGKRFRHLLIEKEGKFIGILSMGDVIKASLNEKTKELSELKATVSWEYYEDWKFKKK